MRKEAGLTEEKDNKPKTHRGAIATSRTPTQANLWPTQSPSNSDISAEVSKDRLAAKAPDAESQSSKSSGARREIRVLQDLLFPEGLLAAKLSADATTLDDLQKKIEGSLRQNSSETRRRYAQSVVRWFFPDGLDGLARKVWVAYRDERVESDILRHAYLVFRANHGSVCIRGAFPSPRRHRYSRELFRPIPQGSSWCATFA